MIATNALLAVPVIDTPNQYISEGMKVDEQVLGNDGKPTLGCC